MLRKGKARCGGFLCGIGIIALSLMIFNSNILFSNMQIDEELNELQEIVNFLTEPEKYQKVGAKLPKGIYIMCGFLFP